MSRTDFIVVGAGSAGCMVASRLAQEHGFRVTLVEPPADPAPTIDLQRPSRWLNLLGSGDDWDLRTEPSAALAGRKLAWPRGRGLGGSSRINAMIWFPPTKRDVQMLIDASGHQWTAEELNTAFRSTLALVRPERPRWLSEASRRFLSAAGERSDATVMVYDRVNRLGRRWNPASLLGEDDSHDDSHESVVDVVRATADRLIWDDDRAIGIRVIQGSTVNELRSERGIVLCGGTIATPAILMRSGIGPRDSLSRRKIEVRVENSMVGQNLQDHLIMPVIFRTQSKHSFSTEPSVGDIARWQVMGTGPVASNIAECGGLFRDDAFQIHVTPTNYLTYPKPNATPTMTAGINVTQPSSRGSIQLHGNHPSQPPLIHSGYLLDETDRASTIRGVRLVRRLASETSLASWIEAEDVPGSKRQSDESIARSIARYAQTLYHPVGTSLMGCRPDSVVDANFAVRETRQLWVADASVLPRITVGNPCATVMLLAWLAAARVASEQSN